MMLRKFTSLLFLSLFFSSMLVISPVAHAENPTAQPGAPRTTGGTVQQGADAVGGGVQQDSTNRQGVPLSDKGLPSNLPRLGLGDVDKPVQVVDSFLLVYVIRPIFLMAGGVAVLLVMYASFRVITARGEEEGLTAAKNTLIWAFAGLALVILSYTLVDNLIRIVSGIL